VKSDEERARSLFNTAKWLLEKGEDKDRWALMAEYMQIMDEDDDALAPYEEEWVYDVLLEHLDSILYHFPGHDEKKDTEGYCAAQLHTMIRHLRAIIRRHKKLKDEQEAKPPPDPELENGHSFH